MSRAPRSFLVPKLLCTSSFGPKVTLDEIEHIAASSGPAATWAKKLLLVENAKMLDELLGEETRLPIGLTAAGDDTMVIGLMNHRGEVWDPEHGWALRASVANSGTIELGDADVAFVARAMKEGYESVIMRACIPLAFIAAAPPGEEASPQGIADLPQGAVVVAVVDSLDKDAVLEMLAVAPGPKVYRRHDGTWYDDPAWIPVLSSVKPPSMVKLTPEQISGVTGQVDSATTGQPFSPFTESDKAMYMPMNATASPYVVALEHEAVQRAIDLNLATAMVAVAGKALTPKDVAATEKLRRYWLYGKGAAKIRWFTPGAWRRCYRNLVKHLGPKMTPGYCTNLSKRLGGPGVATHVGDR